MGVDGMAFEEPEEFKCFGAMVPEAFQDFVYQVRCPADRVGFKILT